MSEQALVKCADLIDLAYRCLEDSAASLSRRRPAGTIRSASAPSRRSRPPAPSRQAKLDVQYLPGTLELDVQDGTIAALRVTTGGSVQVGVVDTQVSISAQFDFQTGLTTDDCPRPGRSAGKAVTAGQRSYKPKPSPPGKAARRSRMRAGEQLRF